MFHSDSGIQYTSKEFFRLLKSEKITQSVSRPGTPLDNAVAESFFATFKKEELYHKEYHTYEELKMESTNIFCFTIRSVRIKN